jgi:hypothetical protein
VCRQGSMHPSATSEHRSQCLRAASQFGMVGIQSGRCKYCTRCDAPIRVHHANRRIRSSRRCSRLTVRVKKVRVSYCDPCIVPPIQPSWISPGTSYIRLDRHQESNRSNRHCRVHAVYRVEMLANANQAM